MTTNTKNPNMISIYNLPFYRLYLNDAQSYNLPIVKRKIELHNRLMKCKSKTKRNKLLKEYRKVKSLCLGLMYGGASVIRDKFTSSSRVIYPSNIIIQTYSAFNLKKVEQLTIAYFIKKGLLKETCCGDCFVVV